MAYALLVIGLLAVTSGIGIGVMHYHLAEFDNILERIGTMSHPDLDLRTHKKAIEDRRVSGQKPLPRTTHHVTRKNRQKTAAERTASRVARTPTQQLAILDARLGTGVGAARERKRLTADAEASAA